MLISLRSWQKFFDQEKYYITNRKVQKIDRGLVLMLFIYIFKFLYE